MERSISLSIDVSICNSQEYAFKTPYEAVAGSEYDGEYTYYAFAHIPLEIACEELTKHYTITIAYISGIEWLVETQEETVILILTKDNAPIMKYWTFSAGDTMRIEIYKQ